MRLAQPCVMRRFGSAYPRTPPPRADSCSEIGQVLHGFHCVHPLNGYVLGTVEVSEGRRYLTFAVVFESQVVAVVPKLVPFTNTATYLPRWVDVSLKVLLVAPVIFLQVVGTVVRAADTAVVQAYH